MLRDFLICAVCIILYIAGTWIFIDLYQKHKISWILRDLIIFVLAFLMFGFGYEFIHRWMNLFHCLLYGLLWGGIAAFEFAQDPANQKRISRFF